MPPATRRQPRSGHAQSGSDSAIEVSTDEVPPQVAGDHVHVDEMDYEEQGVEDEDDEEQLEGESSLELLLVTS